MTEIQKKMMEKLGLSEENFKPVDKEVEQAEALADIWEAICNIIWIRKRGINMASVKRICVALINAEKKKSEPNYEPIIEKMDIFLGANRLTTDEYTELMELIN